MNPLIPVQVSQRLNLKLPGSVASRPKCARSVGCKHLAYGKKPLEESCIILCSTGIRFVLTEAYRFIGVIENMDKVSHN